MDLFSQCEGECRGKGEKAKKKWDDKRVRRKITPIIGSLLGTPKGVTFCFFYCQKNL